MARMNAPESLPSERKSAFMRFREAWAGQTLRGIVFACSTNFLNGVMLPYLPAWLEDGRGLDGGLIGVVLATATLMRVVAGPSLAAWSESVGIRRALMTAAFVLLAGLCALFPTSHVAALIVLSVLCYSMFGAMGPIAEAVLMAVTGKGKALRYGTARSFASAAFIVANLMGGALIAEAGVGVVLPTLVVMACLIVLAAIWLHPPEKAQLTPKGGLLKSLGSGIRLFGRRRLLLLTVAGAAIQASHAHYYNYSSIIWLHQGISGDLIGALWATGVVAEIIFLAVLSKYIAEWSAERLILLGAAGCVVRWSTLTFVPGIEVVFAVQSLHALTFAATHVGTLRAIAEEVPERQIPVAVSINSALAFGPAMALSALLSGALFAQFEPLGLLGEARGYIAMVMLGALGAGFALFSAVRRKESHTPA